MAVAAYAQEPSDDIQNKRLSLNNSTKTRMGLNVASRLIASSGGLTYVENGAGTFAGFDRNGAQVEEISDPAPFVHTTSLLVQRSAGLAVAVKANGQVFRRYSWRETWDYLTTITPRDSEAVRAGLDLWTNELYLANDDTVFGETTAGVFTEIGQVPNGATIRNLIAQNGHIWLGLSDGRILRAKVEGNTSLNFSSSHPRSGVISAIAPDPEQAATLYVSYAELGQDTSNLFVSRDAGETWNALRSATPDVPIRDVILEIHENVRSIYVLSDRGLLLSTDEGATWTSEAVGKTSSLSSTVALAGNEGGGLAVVAAGGRIYATLGSGSCSYTFRRFNPRTHSFEPDSYMDINYEAQTLNGLLVGNSRNSSSCSPKSNLPASLRDFVIISIVKSSGKDYAVTFHVSKNNDKTYRQRAIALDVPDSDSGLFVTLSQGTEKGNSCAAFPLTKGLRVEMARQFNPEKHSIVHVEIEYKNPGCMHQGTFETIACGAGFTKSSSSSNKAAQSSLFKPLGGSSGTVICSSEVAW